MTEAAGPESERAPLRDLIHEQLIAERRVDRHLNGDRTESTGAVAGIASVREIRVSLGESCTILLLNRAIQRLQLFGSLGRAQDFGGRRRCLPQACLDLPKLIIRQVPVA